MSEEILQNLVYLNKIIFLGLNFKHLLIFHFGSVLMMHYNIHKNLPKQH